MTINVVVATFHGVVLGCDSLSSNIEHAFFPFRNNATFAQGADGELLRDEAGNLLIPYQDDQLVPTATNVVGGVQKMFVLYEGPTPDNIDVSVAAITSGLATLSGQVISEIAHRFQKGCINGAANYASAREVAEAFLAFIRPLWEVQVGFLATQEDMRTFLPDLNFLIGGYGPDDAYIKVFRVSVRAQTIEETFPEAPHCSAAWAGQSNSVASLVNGENHVVVRQVSKAIVEALAAQRTSIVESIFQQLRARGVVIPEPFEVEFEEQIPPALPWNRGGPNIDWANLPVQSAVDLVSTLVNAESGIQRFSNGIPMVGGRTRIGLLRRGVSFEFLNEPQIVHSHTGFHND